MFIKIHICGAIKHYPKPSALSAPSAVKIIRSYISPKYFDMGHRYTLMNILTTNV